ncbi:Ferrochelatase, protoheme ferro-lyase [hydrothermal vent metagenome]|uniref:Ferrochelatase, protoheme ferro-lyase n=1 Tax=hydrothermal vent metagenome TaxID=652676 RepID=A0A3B0TZD3_9ZZZZ
MKEIRLNDQNDKHLQDGGQKIGVLLLNLGTPDATDYWSMRRYLKQFLSDRRVIEAPRWLWWPLLNLIILTTRPKRSGALYDKIWDKKANDSPLRVIAASQAKKLGQRLNNKKIVVDMAMRYGNPSTRERILALKEAGCDRILMVPLYPQYSAPTTGTANDKAFEVLQTMRWQPAVRTAAAYYDDPAHIAALAQSVIKGLAQLDFVPELLLTSYHGMPVSYRDKGDPYYYQCLETTRLLGEKLGWDKKKLMVGFQSRFGPGQWLKPYTDQTLEQLAGRGVKKLAVIAPGFSVDCLETLEELAIAGRKQFLSGGGKDFAYIGCLNDSEEGIDCIEALVRRELSGWV